MNTYTINVNKLINLTGNESDHDKNQSSHNDKYLKTKKKMFLGFQNIYSKKKLNPNVHMHVQLYTYDYCFNTTEINDFDLKKKTICQTFWHFKRNQCFFLFFKLTKLLLLLQ